VCDCIVRVRRAQERLPGGAIGLVAHVGMERCAYQRGRQAAIWAPCGMDNVRWAMRRRMRWCGQAGGGGCGWVVRCWLSLSRSSDVGGFQACGVRSPASLGKPSWSKQASETQSSVFGRRRHLVRSHGRNLLRAGGYNRQAPSPPSPCACCCAPATRRPPPRTMPDWLHGLRACASLAGHTATHCA
jgi:hypothetical protein